MDNLTAMQKQIIDLAVLQIQKENDYSEFIQSLIWHIHGAVAKKSLIDHGAIANEIGKVASNLDYLFSNGAF